MYAGSKCFPTNIATEQGAKTSLDFSVLGSQPKEFEWCGFLELLVGHAGVDVRLVGP